MLTPNQPFAASAPTALQSLPGTHEETRAVCNRSCERLETHGAAAGLITVGKMALN